MFKAFSESTFVLCVTCSPCMQSGRSLHEVHRRSVLYKESLSSLDAMDFQRRRNLHVVLFGLAGLVCLPLGFVGPVARSPTGTPGRKLRRISASAITLSRIPTGEGLMQKIDEEMLQRLEEADLEVGMPDMSDLEEMTALMVDAFDRTLAKKRWDESNPFAEYANAFIDADETDKIAKGMQMRLDVSLQYQNLRRPVKQDESMALVARAKQGPLVAYVELCVLANDGRRPEDDDESLPGGSHQATILEQPLCCSSLPTVRYWKGITQSGGGCGQVHLERQQDVFAH